MTKHYLVALALLSIFAVGYTSIQRAQAAAGDARPASEVLAIPSEIGGYVQQGGDEEIEPRVRELLESTLILERNYLSPQGLPIRLSIVYTGVSRRSLHFPEVCIVGGGWEIREQESVPVGFEFEAKRLVLIKDSEQQAVLYWFKTGDELTGNFFLNTWNWTKNQILFGAPTSALIKLSAPLPAGYEEFVFSTLEDFAVKLTPVILRDIE